MNNPEIEAYLSRHETLLSEYIHSYPIPCSSIKEAAIYSLFPGGKRFRPLLVYLCGKLIDVDRVSLDSIAISVELTHCYSLVHDDLPAMDDDDFRRGKLSCHKAFDEATAILVGDGLQALAIDVLVSRLPETLSAAKTSKVTRELVQAIGPAGMVSGQCLDLKELSGTSINEARLREIHLLKTGKLIMACINMVIAAGNPSEEKAKALVTFANHLGLLFQMQDDYLDRYSNAQLGKRRASDTANKKNTYASVFEQSELLLLITQHYEHAIQALTPFKQSADDLLSLMTCLQHRLQS